MKVEEKCGFDSALEIDDRFGKFCLNPDEDCSILCCAFMRGLKGYPRA
jgi:hypothetical protein